MNPAIAAALQLCLSAHHWADAPGQVGVMVYSPGYERCGDIMKEYIAERDADAATLDAIQEKENRRLYDQAVKALPK